MFFKLNKFKWLILLLAFQASISAELILNTLYGEFKITEPVLVALINDPYVQRLKKVRQYGVRVHAIKKEDFSRFDHSIGVFVLLRKYGASLNEQIAGLLHDVSHTVFSHVGDNIFYQTSLGEAYQDNILEKFIYRTSIGSVLSDHNIKISDITQKKKFRALEQDLPDICADRLEYNLRGGLSEGLISQKDITEILEHVKFENKTWYFTDPNLAKKFANISLYHTEHVWGSAKEFLIYKWAGEVIKQALNIDLITINAFHFSTDDIVWQKLTNSQDTYIKENIYKILNHDKFFTLGTDQDYDFIARQKFRGIDPLVKSGLELRYLTELDPEFKQEYESVKNLMQAGYKIKLINNN